MGREGLIESQGLIYRVWVTAVEFDRVSNASSVALGDLWGE